VRIFFNDTAGLDGRTVPFNKGIEISIDKFIEKITENLNSYQFKD
jgi:hypothetical protein